MIGVPVVALPIVDLPFFLWTEDNGSVYPPLVAFQSSSLRITFNFSKQPGNPQTTLIQATFINLTPNVFTDFIFQAAVPKVNPDVFQSASFLLFLYHMLYHNIFFLANLVLWYCSFAFVAIYSFFNCTWTQLAAIFYLQVVMDPSRKIWELLTANMGRYFSYIAI